jgi:3-methyl-2-oxobutanoate hydroxymethyltransferase
MDKITIQHLHQMKKRGEPITMLTAYDYPTAMLVDQSGIEMILVGDSLGMVVHGFETTLPVTMDMMIMHCQAVRRATKHAFLVCDMPFMSYQVSLEDAKRNAGRLLVEGGADAVKLEGGRHMVETIRALVEIGITVQSHIGLTPQSVKQLGFRVQGKTVDSARKLLEDAQRLEEAGAFSIVLEAVPAKLAARISQSISIPTIGIGAGAGCDGQVLVMHDLIGLYDGHTPTFVKQYANLAPMLKAAFEAYRDDVRARQFPAAEHEYSMSDEIWNELDGG